MPVVKALCSAETKAQFRALAAAERLTESMLLRRMVATVVAQSGNTRHMSAETRGGRGGQGSQIKLRLRPAEVQAIRALAEPEGYSAQAWIVRLLRYRLEGAIPFAREELEVQRAAIRELSAAGRNLNTITHWLLRSGQFESGNLKLDALAKAVEQLRREMVATLTRATHRAHRSDD
jgi:hypothetical protein